MLTKLIAGLFAAAVSYATWYLRQITKPDDRRL
jgi:hypothetical protein